VSRASERRSLGTLIVNASRSMVSLFIRQTRLSTFSSPIKNSIEAACISYILLSQDYTHAWMVRRVDFIVG
jgi:hypothetical protein